MKSEEIKTLKLELEGSESDDFKSAIKKLHSENTKAGFKATILTPEELKVITDINQKLNP